MKMARYKDYDLNQSKFIPVVFADQITRGSFEYAINLLVDEHLDMSIFDERYTNDEVGRPAYDPSLLVKIILSAYARGFTSSRDIEKLCRENVLWLCQLTRSPTSQR